MARLARVGLGARSRARVTRLSPASLEQRVAELAEARSAASERFFPPQAERIARLCHSMAERFARGGRLLALAASPQARSDARHVAVEFVHPVIVGKRALPALAIAREGGSLLEQLRALAAADDIVIAFGPDAGSAELQAAVEAAREVGCLTIATGALGAGWEAGPESGDPFIDQELAETLYHVLWELVHVFFEHRGLLEGRAGSQSHDAGASSFLYPFLAQQETDLERVVDDVRASVVMKADEVAELRRTMLTESAGELAAAARALTAGAKVLAFGNGGSATDAMDLVADLRDAPQGWPARPALDLTDDPAILTALANDIGPDVIFSRQVIAYAAEADVAVALSTSGNSASILEALAEARRRGLATVAFVGYDGGRVAAERLADHVIVARSEHIPRIQEAHASGYHILRELVEHVQPAVD